MFSDPFFLHRLLRQSLSTLFGGCCAEFSAGRFSGPWVALLFFLGGFAPHPGLIAGEQIVELKSGGEVTGGLLGDSPATLRFHVTGKEETIPLDQIRSIQTREDEPPLREIGALRKVQFRTGETVWAELDSWVNDRVGLRMAGQKGTLELPAESIAALFQPRGMTTLLFEDFEKDANSGFDDQDHARSDAQSRSGKQSLLLKGDKQPVSHRLAEPFASGKVALSFREGKAAKAEQGWSLEFRFDTQLGERILRVRLNSGKPEYEFAAPLGPRFDLQPLRKTAGWHDFELHFDPLHTMLSIDGHMLAIGPGMKGVLKSWRIVPLKGVDQAELWIDDLQIARVMEQEPIRITPGKQDYLLTTHGDEIYGRVTTVNQTRATLTGAYGEATVPWGELRGIVRRESVAGFERIEGQLCRIQLRSPKRAPENILSTLIVAVQSATQEEITFTHPLLGRRSWPWRLVETVQPLYRGQRQWLRPGVTHLGDEIRGQFRRPEPQGHQWVTTVVFDEVPTGLISLVLDIAQMEPAGPKTPERRDFLQEIREGYLGTRVEINGESAALLNERINFSAAVSHPTRVRVSLPRELFKAGENTISIVQTPSVKDATDYDDCEISRLCLEIVEPGP